MVHTSSSSLVGFFRGLSLAAAVVVGGCGDPEVEARSDVDALELAMSASGDVLHARFDGASVAVEVDAQRVQDERYTMDIRVGEGRIHVDLDDTDGLAVIDSNDFILDAGMADALERFAIALQTKRPSDSGVENKVFRMTSLYAVHPQGEPVVDSEVTRSDDLRDWDSLCDEYYRGDYFTGYYDYECNCSWGFCDSCNGAWGSQVGGNNGDNSCFAVCGAGCGGGSDYSADCGHHDACLNGGYSQYQCSDEFASASDDYAFAPVCTEMSFSFSTTNTNGATQNYSAKNVWLNAGQTLDLGTCSVRGASGSGDTYLRVYLGATQTAANDDSCGLLSRVTFTAQSSGTYQMRAGCYSSGTCSGKATYTIR